MSRDVSGEFFSVCVKRFLAKGDGSVFKEGKRQKRKIYGIFMNFLLNSCAFSIWHSFTPQLNSYFFLAKPAEIALASGQGLMVYLSGKTSFHISLWKPDKSLEGKQKFGNRTIVWRANKSLETGQKVEEQTRLWRVWRVWREWRITL